MNLTRIIKEQSIKSGYSEEMIRDLIARKVVTIEEVEDGILGEPVDKESYEGFQEFIDESSTY